MTNTMYVTAERPTPELWVVLYEDAGVRPEVFIGEGAEKAARARYAAANETWNCHLLSSEIDEARERLEAANALLRDLVNARSDAPGFLERFTAWTIKVRAHLENKL